MAKKTAPLLPPTDELLRQFGDRLRLARLRRRLTAKQVAERSGMSPLTLRSLERGGAGVTIGAYLAVMQVLGIETDLNLLGKADPMGRELQDARLPANAATARASTSPPAQRLRLPHQDLEQDKGRKPPREALGWNKKGAFVSAQALVGLIDQPAPAKKKR